MKKLIFILLVIAIAGCSHKYKTSDLLGTWDCVSSTDVKTGEVTLPKGSERFIVEFNKDSIIFHQSTEDSVDVMNENYGWKIKGDSIFIDSFDSVFIKELTENNLTVIHDFFGEQQLEFKKIK